MVFVVSVGMPSTHTRFAISVGVKRAVLLCAQHTDVQKVPSVMIILCGFPGTLLFSAVLSLVTHKPSTFYQNSDVGFSDVWLTSHHYAGVDTRLREAR